MLSRRLKTRLSDSLEEKGGIIRGGGSSQAVLVVNVTFPIWRRCCLYPSIVFNVSRFYVYLCYEVKVYTFEVKGLV